MASLKELKGRINSVKSTQKITRAKQMVAAAKLRKAQLAAESARPFARHLSKMFESLVARMPRSEHLPRMILGTGADKSHLLVVANSDKGLAGAFNSNIVRAAINKANELIAEGKTVQFYLIGRKGRAPIARAFPNTILENFDTTSYREPDIDEAEAIARDITRLYDEGEFDVAHLFYSRFRSALVQEPTHQQLVPIPLPAAITDSDSAVEYEPNGRTILVNMTLPYLRTQIYTALLENAASEQGASMTAMDNATRNAGELINKLTIEYNRSRQAAITTELIEIIAGAEAL